MAERATTAKLQVISGRHRNGASANGAKQAPRRAAKPKGILELQAPTTPRSSRSSQSRSRANRSSVPPRTSSGTSATSKSTSKSKGTARAGSAHRQEFHRRGCQRPPGRSWPEEPRLPRSPVLLSKTLSQRHTIDLRASLEAARHVPELPDMTSVAKGVSKAGEQWAAPASNSPDRRRHPGTTERIGSLASVRAPIRHVELGTGAVTHSSWLR